VGRAGRRDHLVITADDFGMAAEVNEAVEIASREGVLTATSLMVSGAAAVDAVARARRLPGLAVGLHLTLVDSAPTLPPDRIPRLVDQTGRLRRDLARLGLELALRADARAEMISEIDAQFAAFALTGLALDHVNTHEHYHLHPIVAGLVIDACLRHGACALRVPREPAALLRRLEPGGQPRPGVLESVLAASLGARVRRAGLVQPDHCLGLRWSGGVGPERLLGLIASAPPGLVEIYLHPAVAGGFADAAPGYAYETELAALVDPRCRAAADAAGRSLGGYAAAAAA